MRRKSQGIIEVGVKHQQEFEDELYLHNHIWTYIGESTTFQPIDIRIMDKIMRKLIKAQSAREQKILKTLGMSLEELNNNFVKNLANGNFEKEVEQVQTLTNSIVNEAAANAFKNPSNLYRNKTYEKILYNSITNTLSDLVLDSETEFNGLLKVFNKEGLSQNFASLFSNYSSSRKGKSAKMDKFIQQVSKDMDNYYYNAAIDASDNIINSLFNKQSKSSQKDFQVKQTQQIHFDNLNSIKTKLDTPISFNITSSLENFYSTLRQMNAMNVEGMEQVLQLVDKFNSNNFKYHLIHQAVLFAKQKETFGTQSNITKTLLNFIKKCIPLYVGIEFSKQLEESDFFLIDGELVAGSTIFKKIFDNKQLGSQIDLTYNGNIDMEKMLNSKKSIQVESVQDYYNTQEIAIGASYGHEAYSNIGITTYNLNTTLKNLL